MSVSLPVEGPGDAELISAVRGGDVDAYGDLFARHVDSARRLARQLAGPADADDLVSDAFAKVLTVLQRGGGPDLAFRAYLLTAVRRLHVDKIRAGSRLRPVDDLTPFDPGVPFHDTAVEGFENAAAAKAFASLPERWQMVLWHTEVEQQKPADIAPLLGMSANSVSALAYRAREGLRQAFLSQHATDPDDVDCAWTRDHLGAFIRGGLSRRDATRVEDHLAACRSCAAVYLELTEVNSGLAGILAPLLLGTAGAGYLSSGGGAGAGSSVLSSGFSAAKTWAAAHASLTAIGGMLVTATAVASIYGAAHLHSRNASDLGSPPALNHGSVSTTVGPNGTNHPGHHGRNNNGPGRTPTQSPGSTASGTPPATGPTTSVAPSTDTTTSTDSTAPTDSTTGPTDSTTGPTDPSSSPTDPSTTPTGGPGGGSDLSFTSTPPADPKFGSTYRLHASGGSGKQIVFSIDPATTHRACSLDDAGTTVTFDHAGRCVVAAHADARNKVSTGAARSATDAVQGIQVAREDQDLTFHAPADAAVGGSDELTATSSSGLPVAFAVDPSSTNHACDVTGSSVTFNHALSCSLVASQPGNHDYRAAPDVSRTFDVAKGTQNITFADAAPDDAVVDGTPYAVSATSTSGDPVTVTVDGSATTNNACTLTDAGLAFHHHGTCAITATAAGNADYRPATGQQSFGVGKGTQTISFATNAPGDAVVDGTPYAATATSSTGDPVDLAVDDSATTNNACTLTDAGLAFHHHGTCAITATTAGNTDYLPATAQQSFAVGKGTQTVSFTSSAPGGAVVDGTPYAATATSSTGDPVDLAVDDSATTNNACTLTDAGLAFHHHGTCAITATTAGNADYRPATAQQSFAVGKGTQTVSFTSSAPDIAVVGGTPYIVTATSSTGDPVALGADGACALTGNTVSFQHRGTCTVTASTGADDPDYLPATSQQTFDVGRGNQTITFTSTPPSGPSFPSSYDVTATSSSGGPVTFSSATPAVCRVTGASVTFDHAGRCEVDADQSGTDDYAAAPTVSQVIVVPKEAQTVAFTSRAPTAPSLGSSYGVSATSTSGGSVTFSIDQSTTHNACTLDGSGSSVTFQHAGTCVVDADQAGTDDFLPAPTLTQEIVVPRSTQSISFTSQAPKAPLVGSTYAVSATSTSGSPVAFSSGSPAVCSVSGSTVRFDHAGTCVVDADQAGNADYQAAPTVAQRVEVPKSAQSITFSTTPPAAPAFGSTYAVRATSDSGDQITFSLDKATTRSACTLSGSTVTFAHAGRCVLDADQAGNADYQAAPTASQSIDVPKAAQSITFTSTPPESGKVGESYQVSATGGDSGKPVTFSSTTTKVCTVSGSKVSFVGMGACTVAANQAGNDDYLAAQTATQQVTVGGGRDLTLSVSTDTGWLFGQFGTVAEVTVTGLDPGATATLTATSHNAFVWSPRACDTSGGTTSCEVSSTPTTLSFLGLSFNGSMTFTVTSDDSVDIDPGDNTVTVNLH